MDFENPSDSSKTISPKNLFNEALAILIAISDEYEKISYNNTKSGKKIFI